MQKDASPTQASRPGLDRFPKLATIRSLLPLRSGPRLSAGTASLNPPTPENRPYALTPVVT